MSPADGDMFAGEPGSGGPAVATGSVRRAGAAARRGGAEWSRGAADARLAVLRLYYQATPLFLLADTVLGVNVRASFLPRTDLRVAYYCFCLACAVLCHWRPDMTAVVGIGESSVNLLLIALGVLLPIWGTADAVLAGGDVPAIMTPAKLVNVLLSGSMLILAFHRSQHRLAREFRSR